MIDFVKKLVPHETLNWIDLLIVGIVALIPFSVRHVFNTSFNFTTGAYSDFTSISLYLSDFLIIALIVYSYKSLKRGIFTTWYVFLVIWLILMLFASKEVNIPLQTYFSLRLAALGLFALIISYHVINKRLISWSFVILGGIQSLIAIYQFYFQKSLGLYLLGESHLSPETSGVAKIVTHGTKLIRGYGTFPHSNPLAAFLVIAILFNLYLLTKNYQKQTYLILSAILAINIFGLFITFSRAGIAAGLFAGVGFALIQLINKHYLDFRRTVLPLMIGVLLSIGLLWPYLSTRATITDSAVKERVFYDKIGLKIIKDKPLLGTGAGMSVLHMEQYSDEQLQPWEIQPIHNYYLITLAEWGIAGIIFLLAIVGPILWLCYLTLKNQEDNWAIVLCGTGLAILFLFLFDHYFYTIWPTQILLWLIIGLVLQQIQQKKPS